MIPVLDKQRLPIIPYGPGTPFANEAAVIAAFPVGTPVYDMAETVEANRMKRIRYVVELNGPDTLLYPILATDLRFIPWEIEWVCNDLASTQAGPNRLIQILTSAAGPGTSALVYKDGAQGIISFEFRKAAGNSLFKITGTCPTSGFFKLKIKKNETTSGTCQLYVNNLLQATSETIDYSLWTGADQISAISMVDQTSDLRPYQVANYKGTINGVLKDCLLMNETSGTTLANQCNPSNPATLTDAAAHAKTCVPLSLGG